MKSENSVQHLFYSKCLQRQCPPEQQVGTSSSFPGNYMQHLSNKSSFLLLFVGAFVVAQSLSCVRFFAAPWTAACQASLSFTISLSLLKFMSIESVMLSNHLILCRPLLLLPSIFPSIRVFSSDSISGAQSIGTSASASVFLMNTQD